MNRLLSIIIPAFNEEKTIIKVLEIVSTLKLSHGFEKEIIVINDQSTDETKTLLESFMKANPSYPIRLFNQVVNQGKGAALHIGFQEAKGEYLIPQDADLELDPLEIDTILDYAIKGNYTVVYGSRFLGKKENTKNASFYANQFLTGLSNLFTGLKSTDMETCYKFIRTEIAKELNLKEKRFGFEPEITAKLAKHKNIKFSEIPVSYTFRTYEEGKKIGWKDGVKAMYCILKYSF